jgi:uncharacterized protein
MTAEVLVATTWRCNLRCSYCFVEQTRLSAGGQRMSPALAARVIDGLDAGLADVESICLHLYGGEPLSNLPALEALLDRAEERSPGRFSFAITTNGTCGTPRAIELLGRGRFQVVLSIDGPPAVHDECRRTAGGAPTHARIVRFLEELRARTDCAVRVSAVVRSGWRLADAVAYLETLPAGQLKAQAVRGPEGSPWNLTAEEKADYLADLELLGRKVEADIAAGRTPMDDRFSNRVLQLLAGIERDAFCAAGETTFGITPAGDVLPCVLLDGDGSRLGHIDDDPAAWREAGRRWRRSRPVRPECASCEARPLCGGGCPALLPVCGADECDLVRKNCAVATAIYERFRATPADLLVLAGL